MKTFKSALLCLCLTPVLGFAAPTGETSDTDSSVYLGLNFASISTSSTTSFDGYTGWVLGARLGTPVGTNLYLVPGAQIAARGFSGTSLGYHYSVNITYLELPVVLMAKLPSSDTNVIPFFAAGPNLGLKLGTGCSVDGFSTCTVTSSQNIKTLGLALDILAGAEFPLENGRAISAEVRYHHGLTGIFDATTNSYHRGVELVGAFHF